MKAIWAWTGNKEGLSYNRLRTLQLSAWSYKKLWPEDCTVCYVNSELVEKVISCPEGFGVHDFWDKVVDIGSIGTEKTYHDWSRMWCMTVQDEPFIYVDADFIITEGEVQNSLNDIRKALSKGKKGIYPVSYKTGEDGISEWIANQDTFLVRKILSGLDYDYSKFQDPTGIQATPVVFGSSPGEAFIVGTEIIKAMDLMEKLSENHLYGNMREWVSGIFYRFIARRFNIDVNFSSLVDKAFHLGGGGETPWILGTEESNLVGKAWKTSFESIMTPECKFNSYTYDYLLSTLKDNVNLLKRKKIL